MERGGIVFYQVFLLSPLQCTITTVEICKRFCEFEQIPTRLREFEEIEISRQSCRGDCEYQRGELLRILRMRSSLL
jgi:hypothetical protein